MSDHMPICPSCDELNEPRSDRCAGCNRPLALIFERADGRRVASGRKARKADLARIVRARNGREEARR